MIAAKRFRQNLFLLFILIASIPPQEPALGQASNKSVMEQIRQAQNKRIKGAKGFRFLYEGERLYIPRKEGPNLNFKKPTTLPFKNELTIAGDNYLRQSTTRDIWGPKDANYINTILRDCKILKVHGKQRDIEYEVYDEHDNFGYILDQAFKFGSAYFEIYAFSGFIKDPPYLGKGIVYLRNQKVGSADLVVVGDKICDRSGCTDSHSENEYYLDPSRDFFLVKYQEKTKSKGAKERVWFEVTIDLAPHPQYGFAPTQTKKTRIGEKGKIAGATTLRVKEIELLKTVDPSLFEFEFPEGCGVFDQNTNRDFVAGSTSEKILQGAKKQVTLKTRHIETYETLKYPMGDVDPTLGVCTDLVIRAYRNAGIDLQKLLHEDRVKNPKAYPTHIWEHKKPDRNIDHRRCQNLVVFFSRFAKSIDKKDPRAWRAGDVIFYARKGKKQPWHVGIVSDKKINLDSRMICHSYPPHTQESLALKYAPVLSVHRWPEKKAKDPQ